MKKEPFVTKTQLDEIVKEYPTPFHLYYEKGIRENVKALKEAFAWNKGYKEYFAVKATPNPYILNILKEYGCGCDCSSYTELLMSESVGQVGENIMFSSNDTPAEEFALADKLGVTKSAIGNYENGVSSPKWDVLVKIFDILHVEPNFLYQDDFSSDELPLTRTLTPIQVSLLDAFDQLNEEGQTKAVEYVEDLVLTGRYKKAAADGVAAKEA